MANLDPEQLAASLRRLEPVTDADLTAALDAAVAACVALFGVTGGGLMVADQENTLRAAAASDGPGRVLEEVQVRTAQGPCVDTFVHQRVTTTGDLTTETRWPESRGPLVEHGVRSVVGVPVRLGAVTVGSLDVYRDHPHDWDDSECAGLVRYAGVVETLLAAALRARHHSDLADQLQYALDHRVGIERAVGFLMAIRGIDAVAAFDVLRRAARSRRRTVADVAAALLRGQDLPPP